ncbi:chemotaxis protein CheW [Maribrevibacterium harenarium]|nr:chemotaxis protein CheW [Maribrevibacterium harenarium]
MAQVLEQGICFRMGGENYLHPINNVKEVLPYEEPNPVIGAPACVEGMIELRGNLVTVVYGSSILDVSLDDAAEEGHILVLDLPEGYFGVRVEGVENVMSINNEEVDRQSAQYYPHDCIQGTIERQGDLYILVDFTDYCNSLE